MRKSENSSRAPPPAPFLLESEHQIAVQMQFRLFSFALIVLNCMEYSNCQAPSHRWRRSKRGKTVQGGVCSPQVSDQHPRERLLTRRLESLVCGSREATVLKTSPAPSPEGHGARRAGGQVRKDIIKYRSPHLMVKKSAQVRISDCNSGTFRKKKKTKTNQAERKLLPEPQISPAASDVTY